MGFAGFYRRYVQDFVKIAKPLHTLTGTVKGKNGKKHPMPWSWERPQQEAFGTLIKRLTEPPVLSYPDYTLPFELRVDASRDGLGAVLCQQQGGINRVIAYAMTWCCVMSAARWHQPCNSICQSWFEKGRT